MKTLLRCTVAWAVLLGAVFYFDSQWLELLLIPVLMMILGSVLLLATLIAGCRTRRWLPALSIVGILIAGILLTSTCGLRLGRKVRFLVHRDHYQALLEKAILTGKVPASEGFLQDGPVKRYAFFVEKYVPDGWLGAVYDPTGKVMALHRPGGAPSVPDSPAARELGEFFSHTGSTIENVGGGWYLCWFVYRPVADGF